jgi:hypothetical protein
MSEEITIQPCPAFLETHQALIFLRPIYSDIDSPHKKDGKRQIYDSGLHRHAAKSKEGDMKDCFGGKKSE